MLRRLAFLVLAALMVSPATAAAQRAFTARDLATLDRYSSPALSPDGRTLAYAKRTVDFDANRGSTSIWVLDLVARDAAGARRLTPDGWNVNGPAFSSDGRSVLFLSGQSGSSQLYAVPVGGGEPRQVTALPLDVEGFSVAPDGQRVALAISTFPDCASDLACTKGRLEADAARKSRGVVFDRLFIRHWDTWADGRLNRLFVAPVTGSAAVTTATLVGADVAGDIPAKPFGDLSDLAWSPDGRTLIFSARLSTAQEPWSTNFDLYQVNADGTGAARNLTAENPAWDAGPVLSSDGRTLYYRAMRRPGFEADRFAIMGMDLAGGTRREVAPGWDRSADAIVLSSDGATIYTTAADLGAHPLFAVTVATGQVAKVVGDGSVSAVTLSGTTLVFARATLKSGDQLFTGGIAGAPVRPLTPSAGEMLPEVRWGDFEQFSFKGWNGDTVYGYVVKPWNYTEGQRYPVAFLIHGGPQGSFGNGWSYRWNPQTYAGQGYAAVMIDFHGSTGYGQAFTDAISGHWGDRPLEDLQKGWQAALARYPFLDGGRACALGASYGGYMVNWMAGTWSEPWKCLVSHDGVFDNRMMAFSTEELWFTEWENRGTPYEAPGNFEKFNPVNHVSAWRVPMLVIHGQLDFRIPVEQGIAAFTALQRRGIESKFLYFPDENHWVLKPQNSVLWHETVNAWLKAHTDAPPGRPGG